MATNNKIFRGVTKVVEHLVDQVLCEAAISGREAADPLYQRFMSDISDGLGGQLSDVGGWASLHCQLVWQV